MIKRLDTLLGKEEDIDTNVFPLIFIRIEDRLQSLNCAPFTLYSPHIADFFSQKNQMYLLWNDTIKHIIQ